MIIRSEKVLLTTFKLFLFFMDCIASIDVPCKSNDYKLENSQFNKIAASFWLEQKTQPMVISYSLLQNLLVPSSTLLWAEGPPI